MTQLTTSIKVSEPFQVGDYAQPGDAAAVAYMAASVAAEI